jgi:hypothetical protein
VSIHELKQAIGSAANITMRYEEGGKVQIFDVDGIEYRFPGETTSEQVGAWIKEARSLKLTEG